MNRKRRNIVPIENVVAVLQNDESDENDPHFTIIPSNVENSESEDDEEDEYLEVIPESDIVVNATSPQPVDLDPEKLRPRLKRKRVKNQAQWKKTIRKREVNTGERGRHGNDGGRKLRETCQCKKMCSDNIREEERIFIHDAFWNMNDKMRRRDYLVAHVQQIPKKKQTANSEMRKYTLKYNLPYQITSTKEVCQTFFLRTLDISDYMVRYNLKNSADGVVRQVPPKIPANKTLPERINIVKKHIESFPRIESHYCRSESKREYLDPTLTVCKMYQLYVTQCSELDQVPVKENVYRKIFSTEFNLGFHKPSKDRCEVCMKYELKKKGNMSTDADETDWEEHQQRKQDARLGKSSR